MNEYIENGKKVKEYSYEDWWNGYFNYWTGTLRHAVEVSETKEIYIAYLPEDEYDKICNKQKELFLNKVSEELVRLKRKFESTYAISENKKLFLQNEIENYEKLLFDDKLKLSGILMSTDMPIKNFPYSAIAIDGIRNLYVELIVKGNKTYSLTKSPNCQIGGGAEDFHHVRVEAISQYYEWLKTYTPKDIIYTVKEDIFVGPDFEGIRRQIIENGSIEINSLVVYTPKLAFYFISKELPVYNKESKQQEKINGWQFFPSYEKGFLDGIEFFKANYELLPSVIYGANAESYVRDIHFNYFHAEFEGTFDGWVDCKRTAPFILNHKAFKKYGFYSGIVSKVDEMVKRYPKLFETFDKCDDEIGKPEQKPIVKRNLVSKTPTIKSEFCLSIFNILKDFFSVEEQPLLKSLIDNKEISNPITFLDSGNRLADAFKQLIKSDIIIGCEQKELEEWIFKNFRYRYRKVIKSYSLKYLNDIISTNKDKCQNPIFNVKVDKVTGEINIIKV